MNGLAFFHPAVLWGMAFLAVPVALHLFNRHRPAMLRFSTLRFFQESAVNAQKARTLRRLLQLIARLLIVTLLVLAFAGPYDGRDPFNALSDPRTPVYCWVDPTISMTCREKGVSRTGLAMALLDSMDRVLPGGTRTFLYHDRDGIVMPTGMDEDEKTGPERHGPALLAKGLDRMRMHARAGRERPVYVVFSDMQNGTVAALDSVIADTSGESFSLLCVSLAPRLAENAGVRFSHRSTVNEGVLDVMVYATGADVAPATLQVVAGGLQAGHAQVAITAGTRLLKSIPLSMQAGTGGGSVTIDSKDGFPPDNTDYFISSRSRGRQGLIIGNAASAFPLRAALGAAGGAYWDSLPVRSPESVTSEEIEQAALIVLDNLSYATTAIRSVFVSRSLGRKAILFSPGLDPACAGFNREVLVALGYTGPVDDDSDTGAHAVILPDTLSDLWQGFPRLHEQDAVVERRLPALPGEVLLRMDDGKSFATALEDRNGNSWVLFASPLGASDYNNLCETGFFVPLTDRLSRYALSRVADAADRWFAGVPRRNPWFGARGVVQVYDENGAIEASWDREQFVTLDRPGLYRIVAPGEPSAWVAAVIDTAEANLVYAQPSVVPSQRGRIRVVDAAGFLELIKAKTGGAVAPLLWLFIALFLIAEMLLWERPRGTDKKG